MNVETRHEQTSIQRLSVTSHVDVRGLARLDTCAQDVMAKAMRLTDAWGQAMFILDGPYVEKLFSVLGFPTEVCARVFEKVRGLAYVSHKQQGKTDQAEFTWHITDAACLTLRGAVGLDRVMASVTDKTVESFITNNIELFTALMNVMPEYASRLMFSPEVASTVMATLGANVSANVIYDLAWRYGKQVTRDLDGRRGVSTQFIRALTLVISARIQN